MSQKIPEWQINPEDYLKRLNFSAETLQKKLHLPRIEDVRKILPLRDIIQIESLVPMSSKLLLYMIRKIQTLDKQMPFAKAEIKIVKLDPHHLKIGQKFVYRENYQKLLEEVPDIFHRFLITPGGLADLGAYFIFGIDCNNNYSLACYIPPFVERHGNELVVMDGIHRNYIAKQSGITLNAILIENVDLPFPCAVKDWSEIRIIPLSEKPKDINMRYFELQKNLFRDLKYLGIDG